MVSPVNLEVPTRKPVRARGCVLVDGLRTRRWGCRAALRFVRGYVLRGRLVRLRMSGCRCERRPRRCFWRVLTENDDAKLSKALGTLCLFPITPGHDFSFAKSLGEDGGFPSKPATRDGALCQSWFNREGRGLARSAASFRRGCPLVSCVALRSTLLPRSPSCSLAASSFLLPDCVHRAVCPSYCDRPRPLCRVRPPLGDASRVALDLGRVWPRVAFDPASRPIALRPPAPPSPPPSPCRMFRAKPRALLDNLWHRTTIPN